MRRKFAYSMNAKSVPLKDARAYAEEMFAKKGKDLDEEIPNFDKNYKKLQSKLKGALDVPRIQMPVIEPSDMALFNKRLGQGAVDVFPPYAKGKLHTPKSLSKAEGEEWIELGFKDGVKPDDVVKGKLGGTAVGRMNPTQSQIWLDKVIQTMLKYGVPGSGSPILKQTVIVSSDGYILDGHHRFAQALLVDPGLKMKSLTVPLPIKLLLDIGKTYGESIGNSPKASISDRVARQFVAGELSPVEAGNERERLIIDGIQKLAKKFGFKPKHIGGRSHRIDSRGNISLYIDQPNKNPQGPEDIMRFPSGLIRLMRSVGGKGFQYVHDMSNGVEANHFDWERLLKKAGINKRELIEVERKRVASGSRGWAELQVVADNIKALGSDLGEALHRGGPLNPTVKQLLRKLEYYIDKIDKLKRDERAHTAGEKTADSDDFVVGAMRGVRPWSNLEVDKIGSGRNFKVEIWRFPDEKTLLTFEVSYNPSLGSFSAHAYDMNGKKTSGRLGNADVNDVERWVKKMVKRWVPREELEV